MNLQTGCPVEPEVVRRMCDLIAHRGPDGSGVHCAGPVGLGHRRLAIIDLSPAAAQPMASPDGAAWVVFNGEIYNFLEIRRDLEARGHVFRSHSDTEVLLAAYREFGVECLGHLRGMFAFAIWDATQQTLFAARDRVGKKPFYYLEDADGIAFASEPKAFLADPSFVPEADPQAISHYLSLQYVPSPLSAFRGVKRLPPAHYLVARRGEVRVERYWRLHYGHKIRCSAEEASVELHRLMSSAVRDRLISDVPLGAFLSGGIDSATVVALMAENGASPLRTFSIGFEEREYNELPYARLVAQRYATEHHELVVRPDAVQILPKLVWHYNEPYADASAIPTFYLSEMTRRHVTVALNGDGGDESFAGYDRYRASVLASYVDWVPRPVRRAVASMATQLLRTGRSRTTLSRARAFFEAIGEEPASRYARWVMHFHPTRKAALCTPEFLATSAVDSAGWLADRFTASDAPDLLDATLDVDVATYLPDDLLVKVDIATMAVGLEGRSPFLDHRVMEFAASLPASMKMKGSNKKFVLKTAFRDLVPRGILERPKMGFGVPLEHWFRGELKDMAYDLLLSPRTIGRGYFRREVVARLLDEHTRHVRAWHFYLWNLLMLELWHRTFIDQRPRRVLDDVGVKAGGPALGACMGLLAGQQPTRPSCRQA